MMFEDYKLSQKALVPGTSFSPLRWEGQWLHSLPSFPLELW